MKGFSNQPSMFHPAAVSFKEKKKKKISKASQHIGSFHDCFVFGCSGSGWDGVNFPHNSPYSGARTHTHTQTDTQDNQTGRADTDIHGYGVCLLEQP